MPVLIDLPEKDEVGSNKCKKMEKSGNKIIKILAKFKIRNLPSLEVRICLSSKISKCQYYKKSVFLKL